MTGVALGVPKSTVHYQSQRHSERVDVHGTDYWESTHGQTFLKRLIVGTIYTFGIKGGVGSGRISAYLKSLQLGMLSGVSESSIHRLTKEIESNILWYKELLSNNLELEAAGELASLKLILGLDETWLDEMLLVCQDLTSGYLFLKRQVPNETPIVGGQP
jgi:hypothetical protein